MSDTFRRRIEEWVAQMLAGGGKRAAVARELRRAARALEEQT